ncbi:MAG TPA: hypothetical protein VFZ58_02050 [Candidatus Saccharimonadales bacterium]
MTQYYAAASSLPRRDDRGWRRNQNTVAFRVQRGLGPVTNTIMVILLLSILGLIYLTQITKTSTYGYSINTLSEQREDLVEERDELLVEKARLESRLRAEQSNVASAMVTPTQVDYRN